MERMKVISEAIEATVLGVSQLNSVKGYISTFTTEEVEDFYRAATKKAVELGAIKNPNFEFHRYRLNERIVDEQNSEYPQLLSLVGHLYSQIAKRNQKEQLKRRAKSLWDVVYKPEYLAKKSHEERIGIFAYILDGSPNTVKNLFDSEFGIPR